MYSLYLISVFVHILSITLWFGGLVFISTVLRPAIMNRENYIQIISDVGRKFSWLSWRILFPLILITGLINSYIRTGEINPLAWIEKTRIGHPIFTKFTIFIAVLIISALHDFVFGPRASEEAKRGILKSRKIAGALGRINFILGIILIILGIVIPRGC